MEYKGECSTRSKVAEIFVYLALESHSIWQIRTKYDPSPNPVTEGDAANVRNITTDPHAELDVCGDSHVEFTSLVPFPATSCNIRA